MHHNTRFAHSMLLPILPTCVYLLAGCVASGGAAVPPDPGKAIEYMYVDEANDQLHIVASRSGRFLDPTVFVNLNKIQVVSWTASEITATIDRTGANSWGNVDVASENSVVNSKLLNAWHGTITEEVQGATNLLETATFTVRFRASVETPEITSSFQASASKDASVQWNVSGTSGNRCLVFSKNGTPDVPFYAVGVQRPPDQAGFVARLNITLDASSEVRVTPIAGIYVPQGIKVDDNCTPKTYYLLAELGFSVPTHVSLDRVNNSIPDGSYGGPDQGNTKVTWSLVRESR